jgi:hypothetical protein
VAAPRVIIQGLRQSRLKRVAMNITHELKKIRIGFDKQCVVPASEQWAIVAIFLLTILSFSIRMWLKSPKAWIQIIENFNILDFIVLYPVQKY